MNVRLPQSGGECGLPGTAPTWLDESVVAHQVQTLCHGVLSVAPEPWLRRRIPKLDEAKVLFLIGARGLKIKERARLLAHPSRSTSTLSAFVSGRIGDMPWSRHAPTAIRHLRWSAARHPNSTPQLLMILCGLDDGAYHAEILRHPAVTTKILVKIHRQGLIPNQVACNTKSPEHILHRLCSSS